MRWLAADRTSRNVTQVESPLDVRTQQSRDTEKVRIASDGSESPWKTGQRDISSCSVSMRTIFRARGLQA